jgi:hypothetical protein
VRNKILNLENAIKLGTTIGITPSTFREAATLIKHNQLTVE